MDFCLNTVLLKFGIGATTRTATIKTTTPKTITTKTTTTKTTTTKTKAMKFFFLFRTYLVVLFLLFSKETC